MLTNFQFLNNDFNQLLLEKSIIQHFSYNTVDLFLQELMFLGFEYALNYSFSLNLENFKSFFYLSSILRKHENLKLTYLWSYSLSSIKIFNINNNNSILSFKKFFELIETYKQINPISNSLHLMVTTGAKANWSQLLQLIGFRGYLSNVKGYLYEIPIMQNFQKGLNFYEYFISCYGARKGVIDTALKTADSGYLTRRLYESSREVIIKEFNCGTNSSIYCNIILDITGKKQSHKKFLEGKSFNFGESLKKNILYKLNEEKNIYITSSFFSKIKNLNLNLQGIYNWISGRNICDKCYGLNNKLNNLGESVGALAAQSIGEPGTQLTLRTFHTGGVFTDIQKNLKYKNSTIFNKFNSKLFLNFKILSFKKKYKNLNNNKFINNDFILFKENGSLNLIDKEKNLNLKNIINNINIKNNNFLLKYKDYYNIKKYISLKFISALFLNSNQNIYKQNQLISTYPLDIFINQLHNNKIFNQKFSFSDSYQIINYKSIFYLHKNKINQWLLTNLNTNITFVNKKDSLILLSKNKLICNFNNKYFNILKLKNGFISKSFLHKYLNYNLIKTTFKIKNINYYKFNISNKNIQKFYINSKGFY
uniref:DNA-directed RNA polymerase n=1 Tax=Nephromyces sp. ex Molgula occidentalis TaxID=2544991 RepID=A0A5C1H7G2_9APIC|nr:plastid-encoded DNA-directed RNA polymerase beta''A [Nephromyces sp. ex Molgula occidentalis]